VQYEHLICPLSHNVVCFVWTMLREVYSAAYATGSDRLIGVYKLELRPNSITPSGSKLVAYLLARASSLLAS